MKDYKEWTREKLLAEYQKLLKQKKFGLVWEDKTEEVAEQCERELPVLCELKEKEIKSDNDKPVNILIEGDNYLALYALNFTHKKKLTLFTLTRRIIPERIIGNIIIILLMIMTLIVIQNGCLL